MTRELILVAIATLIGVVVGQMPLTAWFTGKGTGSPERLVGQATSPRTGAALPDPTTPLPARWVVVHRPAGDWSEVFLVLRSADGTDVEETLVGEESHDDPGFNTWFESTMATARARCALFNDALEHLADADTVPDDASILNDPVAVQDEPARPDPAPAGSTGPAPLGAGPTQITYTRV